MHLDARMRLAIVLTPFVITACGPGARRASPAAGPTPESVKPLLVPPSPYYIIYSPPVSLAKPPDTTAHVRKPKS